jgi:hypothetical protein
VILETDHYILLKSSDKKFRCQELNLIRLKYISEKLNKPVTQILVVFDLQGSPIAPHLEVFSYARRILSIDQQNYPERLYKLLFINSPWYFSAIFDMLKPIIDPYVTQRISILGTNYLPQLLDYVDKDNIPEEMGGDLRNVPWCGPWGEESGCSEEQIARLMLL